MNFLLFLWRLFVAIPLSFCVYVFVVLALMQDPINIISLIIWCAIGYLLSLSTLIRAVHRKIMYRGGGFRALMYFLMVLANAVAMPVTLMISIFGRMYRLINYNSYQRAFDEEDPAVRKLLAKQELKEQAKLERRENKRVAKEINRQIQEDAKETKRNMRGKVGVEREVIENDFYDRVNRLLGVTPKKRAAKRADAASEISSKIRGSMWNASAAKAVEKILDDSYKGEIRIDNGVDTKVYKQVALINLNVHRYALLAEYGEDGAPAAEADIFAIVSDPSYGRTLAPVEEPELTDKIFSVYRTILAEKSIYNA